MARVTVEDCLKNVDNRFQLVHVAVLRSRQLDGGYLSHVEDTGEKNTIVALREIAEGKVDKEIIKKQSAGIFDSIEEGKSMEESFRDIAQQELSARQRQAAIEEQTKQQEEEAQSTKKKSDMAEDIGNTDNVDNIKTPSKDLTKKKPDTAEDIGNTDNVDSIKTSSKDLTKKKAVTNKAADKDEAKPKKKSATTTKKDAKTTKKAKDTV